MKFGVVTEVSTFLTKDKSILRHWVHYIHLSLSSLYNILAWELAWEQGYLHPSKCWSSPCKTLETRHLYDTPDIQSTKVKNINVTPNRIYTAQLWQLIMLPRTQAPPNFPSLPLFHTTSDRKLGGPGYEARYNCLMNVSFSMASSKSSPNVRCTLSINYIAFQGIFLAWVYNPTHQPSWT